VCKVKKQGLVL